VRSLRSRWQHISNFIC